MLVPVFTNFIFIFFVKVSTFGTVSVLLPYENYLHENFPTAMLGDLEKIMLAKHWITVNAHTMIAMGNFFVNLCL